MNSFKIYSDSSCDFSDELVKELDVTIVPFYICLNGTDYLKEKVDITIEKFYDTMISEKVFPHTSLPSSHDYMEAFTPALKDGFDVLCICITSKFSGSYQSAVNAANMLSEDFPDRKIIIVDSQLVAVAQAQLVIAAHKLKSQGKTIEEVSNILNELKLTSKIYLTVDSLEYLQRGGRIGKVSALAGGLLGIKPIIVIANGELNPHSKVRGRKKAINQVAELVYNEIKDDIESYTVSIVHSRCIEECLEVGQHLKTEYGINYEQAPFELGTTVGAHIGPSVIAISYMKRVY